MILEYIKNFKPVLILQKFFKNILSGYIVYSRILRQYEKSGIKKFYFMYYPGSGDTYLTCSDLQSHGLITTDDIYIGPSGTATKIANLFNFKEIVTIQKEDALKICDMDRFCGLQLKFSPLVYESFSSEYLGILRRMEGYHGFNFMDMLRIGLERNCNFHYSEKPLIHTYFSYKESEIDNIFQKNELIPGRTVLISPYMANFAFEFFTPFWSELVRFLKKSGYCICLNSTGSSTEPLLSDTIPILIPYRLVGAFCERAGFFIGIRSGLCDIISGNNCKKFILYPKLNTGVSEHSWMDFFSLNKMKLCDDAIEFELNEENRDNILQLIQQKFLEDSVY